MILSILILKIIEHAYILPKIFVHNFEYFVLKNLKKELKSTFGFNQL